MNNTVYNDTLTHFSILLLLIIICLLFFAIVESESLMIYICIFFLE